jgi:hypothetical protein
MHVLAQLQITAKYRTLKRQAYRQKPQNRVHLKGAMQAARYHKQRSEGDIYICGPVYTCGGGGDDVTFGVLDVEAHPGGGGRVRGVEILQRHLQAQ